MTFSNASYSAMTGTLLFGAASTLGSMGCFQDFDQFRPGSGGSSSSSSSSSIGSTGGMGGGESTSSSTGGMGGTGGQGGVIVGNSYIPSPLRPSPLTNLPPTHAFTLWTAGNLPPSLSLDGFELCSTNMGLPQISGDADCPNSVSPTQNYSVIAPLSSGADYYWKIRARFSGNQVSEWSAVQAFTTDNSLNAWWPMNGDAQDISGSGNNGTLQNGADFVAGFDGQALQCDGVDNFVDAGGNLDLQGPLTVSAWVKGNGVATSADSGILNLGILNYALTYHTNGQVYFYVNTGGNNLHATMSPNVWHHVVGVFDGTTLANGMNLYMDDVLAGSMASATAATGASGNLSIGRYAASYFNGLIDDVTIYDAALSGVAVQNEFCSVQALGGANPLPAACQP